jgi:hypothetical protein
MSQRNSKPLVWSPHGASDTLDSSGTFTGAMGSLQNLIPDPTTKDLWQCRPAAQQLVDFVAAGFNTPTFISCWLVVGSRVYGMVSTARFTGHDEPFVYDVVAQAFVSVAGVTALNTPISPTTTGTWKPPNMDLIGSKVICAHPGFTGSGGAFFGVIDVSTFASPVWSGTNTSPTALVAPPQWVQNFNGRCYFLVNPPNLQPAAYFSDSLNPTVITNANQILTFGDNVPLTCAMGLALLSQLGGIVQSLMVFKSVANIYQVTGDSALSTLMVNTLNVATGTLAPNSVCSTSKGLAFIAPDGLRVIDFNAKVGDPIGNSGEGVTAPFIYALTPSRMAAAYNSGIYRVQVQNGIAAGNPQQQWWYDFVRQIWSGPHTQAASLLATYSNTFLAALQGVGAQIFQSDPVQTSTSTYNEAGTQLQFVMATPMLPDIDQMAEISMTETTAYMALVPNVTIVVSAFDQDGAVLDAVTIVQTGAGTVWGAFTWGSALWQGTQNALYPRRLSWHIPLVFRRLGLSSQGNCVAGLKLGRIHMRYQVLGYLQEDAIGTGTFVGNISKGTFTLTANATTTVVNNAACLSTSEIFILPTTPHAANDMATTSIVPGVGSFTVTHANNARIDRTFNYGIFN